MEMFFNNINAVSKIGRWLVVIIFILCFTAMVTAQQNETDSLLKVLSYSKADTGKLIVLDALIESITDNAVWQPYNEQMGTLAQALMKSNSSKVQVVAKKYEAIYFNNLGYLAEAANNIPLALDCYYRSLSLNESANDKKGIANALNNIGVLKDNQGDKEEALQHYLKSLHLRQAIADTAGIAQSLSNIGTIYDNKGEMDNALSYYRQSLKLIEGIDDKATMGVLLSNIGGVYDKKNDNTHALEFYTRSLKIEEEIGDTHGIYVSQINFGNIYMKQKNYAVAEKYFEHAMDMAKEIGSAETIYGAANWLSKIYSAQGKYKAAYEMQVLYKQLADSISNAETRKQAVKKQMQYEFEKKEATAKAEQKIKDALAKNEIEKQRQVKTIIIIASLLLITLLAFGFINFYKRKREVFKKTVEQVNNKALRSQMNPHFIFNSLNSIQDFISANDSKNANAYLIKFAKLVRMILENSRKQEILLSDDLKALELYMQLESLRLKNGFDYELKIDPAIDTDATLVPPLIIQPFVENAIWHGLQHKTERGKIIINISKIENDLQCIVEDNGVGRVIAQTKKTETNPEKRKSLGMEITKERIQLYNSIKNAKAFFEITDILNANNVITGVRVLLRLPFEEAF